MRADRDRRQAQRCGAHRRAGERQHRVDADGPQQRALAGHVRAADDEQLRLAGEANVIRHHGRREAAADGQAARPRRSATACGGTISGNGSLFVLVSIAGKRTECFELGDGLDPDANPGAVPAAPAFDRERDMRGNEQQQRGDRQVRARAASFGRNTRRRGTAPAEGLRCSSASRGSPPGDAAAG